MSNPARYLHDLFTDWAVPQGKDDLGHRIDVAGDAATFYTQHIRAAECLREIRMLLDGLEASGTKIDVYRRAYPHWCAGVLACGNNWRTVNTEGYDRFPLPAAHFEILEGLATQFDTVAATPTVTEDHQAQIRDAVSEARALLADPDSALPQDAQRYLLGLLAEADACLEEFDTFGAVGFRSITMQLGGALMTAAAAAAPDSKARTKFSELASKFMFSWGGLALNAGSFTTSVIQLTSGG